MHQVAPLAARRESLPAVLASSARNLSDHQLSVLALGSGAVAVASALLRHSSWILLGACYVVWCYAGWGVLFRSPTRRTVSWRALEWLIAGSATAVAVAVGFGVFFWALGSHWQL
jgi:hypothetical protein